jgi:hypothetical protein
MAQVIRSKVCAENRRVIFLLIKETTQNVGIHDPKLHIELHYNNLFGSQYSVSKRT